MTEKSKSPRPVCPECGQTLCPTKKHAVITDEQVATDELPEGLALNYPEVDMALFAGIYCSSDCVIDSHTRGYPKHRKENGI